MREYLGRFGSGTIELWPGDAGGPASGVFEHQACLEIAYRNSRSNTSLAAFPSLSLSLVLVLLLKGRLAA